MTKAYKCDTCNQYFSGDSESTLRFSFNNKGRQAVRGTPHKTLGIHIFDRDNRHADICRQCAIKYIIAAAAIAKGEL